MGRGWGTEGRILSKSANKEKWTEASMEIWEGAVDRGKNLFQPTKKVDRGRHKDLGRGCGLREEFSPQTSCR